MNRMMTWAVAALLAMPFAGTALASPGTTSLDGQILAKKKSAKKGKKKRKLSKRNPCRILKRVAKKKRNKVAHKVAVAGLKTQKTARKVCKTIAKKNKLKKGIKGLLKKKKGAKKRKKIIKKKRKIRPRICLRALRRARKGNDKAGYKAAKTAIVKFRTASNSCRKALAGLRKGKKPAKPGDDGGKPEPEKAPTDAEVDAAGDVSDDEVSAESSDD